MLYFLISSIISLLACVTNMGTCGAKRDNILVIGDSLACGSKLRMGEVLRKNESADWECKVGTTIEFWNAGRAKNALDRHQNATSVIIFLGTNNYYQTSAPAVSNILKEINDRNLKCVWVGNTAVRGKKWPINASLKASVQPTCTYIDAENAGINLPDAIHPSWDSWLILLKMIWSVR